MSPVYLQYLSNLRSEQIHVSVSCFPQLIFLSAIDLEIRFVHLLFDQLKLELLDKDIKTRRRLLIMLIEPFQFSSGTTSLLGGEQRGGL